MQTTKLILLAEDDVLVRLALAEFLRSCGHRVIEAVDAMEAKTVLQKGPDVDLLLADVQLAGEGGFALAQWVRRYRPQVSVVMMGGLAHKIETAEKLCEAPKRPCSGAALLQRIQAARSRKRVNKAAGRTRGQRRLHS